MTNINELWGCWPWAVTRVALQGHVLHCHYYQSQIDSKIIPILKQNKNKLCTYIHITILGSIDKLGHLLQPISQSFYNILHINHHTILSSVVVLIPMEPEQISTGLSPTLCCCTETKSTPNTPKPLPPNSTPWKTLLLLSYNHLTFSPRMQNFRPD